MKSIKEKIRVFIVENFLFGDESGLQDSTSFFDEGVVDSMGILELVEFLKEEFSITIEDEELLPENLDSIDNVVSFLMKKSNVSTTVSQEVPFYTA
jgi:acyl carrier protein